MKAEKEHIDELIVSYLSNELDGNAVHELKEWIAASVENEKYFMQRQEIWFSAISVKEDVKYDKSKAFEQFKNRIANQRLNDKRERENFCLSKFWRYAAVIVVLFSVSYFSYWRGGISIKEVFSDIIVEAPLGSRTKLTLPDGTLVWLNAGSRITYSQGFGVGNRKIELIGEGYFEVKRNEEVPFLVKTNSLLVKVLGTKFNVKAYFDEKSVVTLAEGKVEVETNDCKNRLTLKPNEQVSYSGSSGLALEKNINTNTVKLWMKGEGAFIQCRLDHIVRDLERKFDVKIVITDHSLSSEVFTCRFKDTATIEQVLHLLKETRRLDYLFEGEQIRIFKPLK